MKNIIITYCFTFLPFISFAQNSNVNCLSQKIGGISFEEQLVLDKATIGILYEFEQQATKKGKSIQLKDTLLLAIGDAYSIFLDPRYKENLEKARKARKARSLKAKRVNVELEKKSIDDFVEIINAGSDYKEENNGYPIQIYKNKKNDEITSIFNAFIDNLQCTQSIPEMKQWTIIEGTDTILGYFCQKATTSYAGRSYTAWFTLDIPINDGPWKLHGLPGLILKAEDNTHSFRFIAVGIQQYKDEAKVEIVKDRVEYDTGTLQQFNKFVEKEISQYMVSFYNNGELYITYKKSPVKLYSIEVVEK